MGAVSTKLLEIYDLLNGHFGPLHWWPAESPFEVIIGAVLTQNTSWKNVEKSIASLRQANLLSFTSLLALPEQELAEYIRSSGYYNLKAKRLKNLLQMIDRECHGDLNALFADDTQRTRELLLQVKGIGPETADSILLYGGGHPTFVVDAYTYRILSRHSLIPEECDYQYIQDLFMDNLEHDAPMFNQYHALLVRTAKRYCKKTDPHCDRCPLQKLL